MATKKGSAPTAHKKPAGAAKKRPGLPVYHVNGQRTKALMAGPEWAAKKIAEGGLNRPRRKGWINELAKIILAGEWQQTHQGIAITKSGKVIDGQNRLHAIVKAGVAVPVNVTTGCSEENFWVIDEPKTRSAADKYYCARGGKTSKHKEITAVANAMLRGVGRGGWTRIHITRFALAWDTVIEAYLPMQSEREVIAPVVAAFCNARLYFGSKAIKPLANAYASGEYSKRRLPALDLLRTKLWELKSLPLGQKVHMTGYYGATVNALRRALGISRSTGKYGLSVSSSDFGTQGEDRVARAALKPRDAVWRTNLSSRDIAAWCREECKAK